MIQSQTQCPVVRHSGKSAVIGVVFISEQLLIFPLSALPVTDTDYYHRRLYCSFDLLSNNETR